MLVMLPRPCCTDWSGHSSLTVVTGAVGIPCGAVSWRLPELYPCWQISTENIYSRRLP